MKLRKAHAASLNYLCVTSMCIHEGVCKKRFVLNGFAHNKYVHGTFQSSQMTQKMNWQHGHDSTFQDQPRAAQDAGQMATKSAIAHIEVATPLGIRT